MYKLEITYFYKILPLGYYIRLLTNRTWFVPLSTGVAKIMCAEGKHGLISKQAIVETEVVCACVSLAEHRRCCPVHIPQQ